MEYFYLTEDDESTMMAKSLAGGDLLKTPISQVKSVLSRKYPSSDYKTYNITQVIKDDSNVSCHAPPLVRDITSIYTRIVQHNANPRIYSLPELTLAGEVFVITSILSDMSVEGASAFAAKRANHSLCTIIFDLSKMNVSVTDMHPAQYHLEMELRGVDGYRTAEQRSHQDVDPLDIDLFLHQLNYSGFGSRGIRAQDYRQKASPTKVSVGSKYLNVELERNTSGKHNHLVLNLTTRRQRIDTMISLMAFLSSIKLKTTTAGGFLEITDKVDGGVKKFHALPNPLDISTGRLNLSRYVDHNGDFIVPLIG